MLPMSFEVAHHSFTPRSRSRGWLYFTACCYLALILLAPRPTSGQVPESPRHDPPEFKAAIALGGRLFVLHEQATSPIERSNGLEALPLVQGQALLLRPAGRPLHSAYTLALPTNTCSATSRRRVKLELDSGEPEAPSALGPAWLADEVNGCGSSVELASPVVALAGRQRFHSNSASAIVPQRVIQGSHPVDAAPCELGSDEFLDAVLELRQSSFAVLRSFRDLDRLRVVSLDGASHIALDVRASLFWDDEFVGC